MQTYTKEEIEARKKYFKERGYREVNADVADLNFSYFILPQSLNKDLPNFVFRMTSKSELDGVIFGISESVREDFRKYAIAHEVIEFSQIGIDKTGRCVQAMEIELSLIPSGIKEDYIKMRTRFFSDLIKYYTSFPNYDSEDVAEFSKSLRFLEDKLKKD